MADIRLFRAYRASADLVQRVASPPYDVVTTSQARALAEGNPDSFLRVSRPEIGLPEGTDEHSAQVYAAGKSNLAELIERNVLSQDAAPHLYLYSQRMGEHVQTGVVSCVPVADYLADRIKKHEKTRPDKEDDRTQHIDALEAHDEPVFLTYRQDAQVDALVAEIKAAAAPIYDFESVDGIGHQFWVVSEADSAKLATLFGNRVGDLYVADGHHRSAAAARVHAQRGAEAGDHGAFLAVLFPHDQLQIMAYNRVVKDREGRTGAQILEQLGKTMDVVHCEQPQPDVAASFGLYVAGRWYRVTALPGSFDDGDPVARLDCQICQDQILNPIFGIEDPRRDESIGFVGGIHGAAELERRVDEGKATVALYLHPTSMQQVMAVSDASLVMPPKSTWFEPKLRSGLFVHAF